MTHLKIAAIQLDYQPVTRTSVGGWRLDEPLAPLDPLADVAPPSFLLDSLKGRDRLLKDVCERTMKETRQTYMANLTEKLREIMTFCYKHKVDLVVFPEYSIPLEAIEALRAFSNSIAVIAGLGYLRRVDIKVYQDLDIDVAGIAPGNNVAVVLTPKKNLLIAKKNPAEHEDILPGAGPRIETIQLEKGTFTVGTGICLDFLQERTMFNQRVPDMVVIPSLSRNISEFVNEPPRNYARVFANHSTYGGTYIGAPGIKGLRFVDERGTIPLNRGLEGIIIVDWDFENPFQTKPSKTQSTDHHLYARAALIYAGRDSQIAQRVSRIDQIPSENILRVEDLLQISIETRADLQSAGQRYALLREALDMLEDGSDYLAEDEVLALSRHCILSAKILSVSEWKYQQCISVAEQLKRLQDRIPEIVSAPLGEYAGVARDIAVDVRVNRLELRHKGPVLTSESETKGTSQLVLFARLGPFGEEAVKTLPRQLTLLRTIAELQDPHLTLRYRLQTWRDSANVMHAIYDVICTTEGLTQIQIEELRQGLGQLIHITFTGAYSIGYTVDPAQVESETVDIRESSNWWAEIGRVFNENGEPLPFRGMTDWSLIIDLLRSLNELTIVELQCSAMPFSKEATPQKKSDVLEPAHDEYNVEESKSAVQIFTEMLEREKDDLRRLSLRIFVGGKEPLPAAIVNSIGVELAGANHFQVLERINKIFSEDEQKLLGLSPIEVLRTFHPPFGTIYPTAGEGRFDLDLKTNESQFPPTGVMLGKARIRQVRSDEEIEVRLSEIDRLRHLYVVGRTGTGKTNLLKLMASQDVQVPGRGVTIIDPHGDLVDHVLREIPEGRLHEVTLIDLARTDALPVLNPLDIDRKDITRRDRTIQELIWLLHSRVYHEYTGPRFDEMVRLAFETMLDEGYPESASFVDVPRLFMDESVQIAVKKLLKDEELKRRWQFQDTVGRSPDYGELVHWLTSKFEDISRDSTLRVVMGGSKSTIQIEQIVQQGGILLVRIPEAVIGKQAADFVGSLILLQLRMAIIRRREFGKLQHYHFVYVDEFQNFANTDFHTLVAEARKFNIGFTLANQNLEQLREFRTYTGVHEQRLISAIFGNVGNLVIFGVGALDANFLSEQVGVSARDIMRIGRYQALAKLLVNGFDSMPFTLQTGEAIRLESPRNIEVIEKRMRASSWVEPKWIQEEVNGRLDRVIKYGEAIPDPEANMDWLRPQIFNPPQIPALPEETFEETSNDIVPRTLTEDNKPIRRKRRPAAKVTRSKRSAK